MRIARAAVAAVALVGSAQAATLLVDDKGNLMGADGVYVEPLAPPIAARGGSYFSVRFVDGVCADIYSGCNEVADFAPFGQAKDPGGLTNAYAATRALTEQVFIGEFARAPRRVVGCDNDDECSIITPFRPAPQIGDTATSSAVLLTGSRPPYDGAAYDDFPEPLTDSTSPRNGAYFTFAVWTATPVPEPATWAALALGLLGIALRHRPTIRCSSRCRSPA